jgi:RNA polymerase sigma factor (sigma-70 family)
MQQNQELTMSTTMSKTKKYNTKDVIIKAQKGCKIAQEQLLKENEGLLRKWAAMFRGPNLEMDDAFQLVCEGFLDGVARFDCDSGNALTSYVWHYARNKITEARKVEDWSVSVSSKVQKEAIRRVKHDDDAKFCGNWNKENVDEYIYKYSRDRSYSFDTMTDRVVDGNDDDREFYSGVDLGDTTVALAQDAERKARIDELLSVLDPREKEVIRARFLGGDSTSRGVVGETLGCCRERIRQIEVMAIAKLTAHAEAIGLTLEDLV